MHPTAGEAGALMVSVTTWAIEDGEISVPEIGGIGELPLVFHELHADPADPSIVTLRAAAEPLRSGKPSVQETGTGGQWWEWTVLLRGTGWTATWYTRRPVVGQVEVTGRLVADLAEGAHPATTRVRGRVARLRVEAVRYRREAGLPHEQWKHVPGTRHYRDVATAPRWFTSVTGAGTPDVVTEGIGEVGLLVDLVDLVDVPPPPPRPSIIPGAVSAHDTDVWVVDHHLPLVVRLDSDRRATEYSLPGRIYGDVRAPRARSVWAHAHGCWVGGRDGIYHCSLDGVVNKVSDASIRAGAAHGEVLLAVTAPSRGAAELVLVRPDGSPVVTSAVGWGAFESMCTVDDGFLLLFRQRDPGSGALPVARLVRVDLRGTATLGPPLSAAVTSYRPFLAGTPPTVFDGRSARRVLDDLSVAEAAPLPNQVDRGGQVGDLIWVAADPPRATASDRQRWWAPERWWPLPGPPTYTADHQYWLFTLLDGTTLEAISSTPIRYPEPDVALDGAGTVWVTARGLQAIPNQTIPNQAMTPPVPVDVAALVDRSRARHQRT